MFTGAVRAVEHETARYDAEMRRFARAVLAAMRACPCPPCCPVPYKRNAPRYGR